MLLLLPAALPELIPVPLNVGVVTTDVKLELTKLSWEVTFLAGIYYGRSWHLWTSAAQLGLE